MNALRLGGHSILQRIEAAFDVIFGAAHNPWRHLGALGFYFFWLIASTGLYLYAVLDTSVEHIGASINYYSREQWYLGGLLRSIHRYASDAFVVVVFLHLAREFFYGRYVGVRWYAWITGVPLIWLAYASGIGGYWLVWDQMAQFSIIASAEWLDWLPIVTDPMARNFLTPGAVNDRLFSLLMFLHIGIPLMLLLALWVHIQRISRADVFPSRSLGLGSLAMLILLSFVQPVASQAPADLAIVPTAVDLDWLLLFVNPLMYATSPAALWAVVGAFTLLIAALPFLPLLSHKKSQPVAVVTPEYCNGCERCFDDCPYSAITMLPHPDKPGHRLAQVDAALCVSCGICAGACPSSTPFRSADELVSGIDMPQQSIGAVRQVVEARLGALTGSPRIVVFGCDCAVALKGVEVTDKVSANTATISVLCIGLLPPSLVEYTLRNGADGVLITGCREGSCAYRFGNTWTEQRLSGEREPHLRINVPAERLCVVWADAHETAALVAALTTFRNDLQNLGTEMKPLHLPVRRISHHD